MLPARSRPILVPCPVTGERRVVAPGRRQAGRGRRGSVPSRPLTLARGRQSWCLPSGLLWQRESSETSSHTAPPPLLTTRPGHPLVEPGRRCRISADGQGGRVPAVAQGRLCPKGPPALIACFQRILRSCVLPPKLQDTRHDRTTCLPGRVAHTSGMRSHGDTPSRLAIGFLGLERNVARK
jgi:hypothetical protein